MRRWLTIGLAMGSLMFANTLAMSSSIAAEQRFVFGSPLTFGMNPDEVSVALGVPLAYVRGRRGDELLLAMPNVKGSALTIRSDALYLQFRHGRLTGWKGDWGTAKPEVVGW